MNSNRTSNPRSKGRGKFYLLVIAAIAMSALIGACACEDSPTLELNYPAIIGTINTEIGETAPEWSSEPGKAVEYEIEQNLPNGLSLATDTGIISGTPRAVITGEYTITATLASGTVKQAALSITIADTAVGASFTYEPIVGAVGGEIAPGTPQWARSLSKEITYTIAPSLPAGLTLDPATGAISGNPEAIWEGDHTVTAAYGGWEKTGVVSIRVLSKNTLPGPPTALTVVTGDETAQVGWAVPDNTGLVDNAAGIIRGYKVYWDEVAAPTKASTFLLIGDSATVSAAITGLTNGRIYYFAAAAFNQLGEGELSEAITTPANKPGKLAVPSAIPSGGAITVSWLPPLCEVVGPMEDLTGYKVYYRETSGKDELVQEVGPETTSVTFEGLKDGIYSFRVTAAYGRGEKAGESESSDPKEILLSQTPPVNAVPGQPWSVKAKAGNGEITVTWAAPADTGIVDGLKAGITSFRVYYDEGTGSGDITTNNYYEIPFGDTSAEPSLGIGNLDNGKTYVIAVVAINDEGEGPRSEPATSQPREENRPPTAPAITEAIAMDGEVKLTWSPPADTGMVEGIAGSLVAYGVYFARGEAPTESSEVRMIFNVNDTSLVIDELENAAPYQFSVRAYTTAGESDLSEPREAAPKEDDRVPGAPGQPSAVLDTSGVRVSWPAPDDVGIVKGEAGRITGYNIHYSLDADDIQNGAVEEVRPAGKEVPLTWAFTLADGGSYYFAVAAVTGAGAGELSAAVQTDRAPGKPSKPQALPGDGTITVRWHAPADSGILGGVEGEITGYKVYYKEEGAVGEPAFKDLRASDREVVLDLTNGIKYFVSVAAVNGAGEGEPSEEKEAEPTAGPLADRVPDEPWDVRVIEGDEALSVTWRDPADRGVFQGQEAVITKFEVYYAEGTLDPDALTPREVDLEANPDAERKVELTGLTNGTTYKVAVRTVTPAGTSPLTAEIEGTPQLSDQVPGIPSITLTEAEHEKVTISWSAPDTPGFVNGREAAITGYKIYYERGVEPAKTSSFVEIEDGAALEGAVTNLVNGRTYHFAVSALNGAGEGELSDPKTAQPYRAADRPPGAPRQELAPLPTTTEKEARVSWEAPDDTGKEGGVTAVITGYRVYYRLTGGTLTKDNGSIEDVDDAAERGAVISGLTNGVEYQFAVTAVNAAGEGGLSSIKKLTLTPARTVSFDAKGSTSVPAQTVAYGSALTEPAPTLTGHALGGWYTQDGSSDRQWGNKWDFTQGVDTAAKTMTLYAKWDIQSYQVTFESHGGSGVAAQTITYDSLVTAPTSDPTRGGYTFAGWYGEDGENNGGNWGTPWDFTQDKVAAQAMTLYARWYSPPSAPGNLVVSSYDDDSVTLSWDGSNNPGSSGGAAATISDYKVYYSTTNPVDTSSAFSVSTNTATTARISGLISSTSYYFVVLAANSVGLESTPSNEAAQTTDLSDTEKAAADKGDLDIRSAAGGDLQAVKADFTLPVTGGRGTAISWAVTSGTAIALGGTNGENADVTRPTALGSDNIVVLRASITLGSASETKDFTLTVKKAENLTAQESVDKDKTALTVNSFQFAQGDTYGQVTQDFTLPTTGGEGSAISWTLTSGTAISLSGTRNETAAVTRPNYVDGSAAVELKATITKGSASETKSFTLTVYRKDRVDIANLGSAVFSLTVADTSVRVLTGRNHTAAVTGSLTAGTDYVLTITGTGVTSGAVSIDNNGTITITGGIALTDAGNYTVKAVGQGNYRNEKTATFTLTVNKRDLGSFVHSFSVGDKDITALTGGTHRVTVGGSLMAGTDYDLRIEGTGVDSGTVRISNSGYITITSAIALSDAGEYTVMAIGKNNYSGTVSDDFFLTVTAKSLTAAGLTLSIGNTAVTALTAKTFDVTVGGGLTEGADYDLTITGPGVTSGAVSIASDGTITLGSAIGVTHGGGYIVTATGKNNYSGTVSDSFTLTVNRKDITTIQSFDVSASDKAATFRTGETYQGGTMGGGLEYGTDYGLAITTKAGGAANFFSVDSVDSSGIITFTITNAIALSDAGTYTLKATCIGNYTGSVSDDFGLTVTEKSLTAAGFTLSIGNTAVTALTGGTHTVTVGGGLRAGTDYDLTITGPGVTSKAVSIDNNGTIMITGAIALSDAGTYTLGAAGKNNYTGSVSDDFELTVTKKSLTDAGLSLTIGATSVTAGTGGSHKAAIVQGLTAASDYILEITAPAGVDNHLSITNNGTITIDPAIALGDGGDYTVTATGQNNYTNTVSATFRLTVTDQPTLGEITYSDGDFTLDVYGRYNPIGINSDKVNYAMKTGSLPAGLTLFSFDGDISGTPTKGSPRTAYTIVATGKSGTPYEGEVKEITIRISVDNAVGSFFDFDPPTEVEALKNGEDLEQALVITRNERTFFEGTEYRWAITQKSSGKTPGFMRVSNNKLWITGADIPGSTAAGTYELTAVGQGRYSGEITEEFELTLPADSPLGAPTIIDIASRDGALVVSWSAPADRGFYDGVKGVITEYTVYWDTTSGLTKSTAANSRTVALANNSFKVGSLTNGQRYYFIVTAATGVGEGPASSAVSGTPSSGNTPPGAPRISSATAGHEQVEVGWTAPTDPGLVNNQPGSPGYRIYYSRTPNFGLGQADGYREAANSAASLVVDQLTNLDRYYFRVTAYTAAGESSASTGVLTATPWAVALNANGGTGEPAEAITLLKGKIPDYSYGTLERSGYAFAGWNTVADGSGTTYRSGDDYSFQDVTTLYAYWMEATDGLEYTLTNNYTEYSVTYNKDGLTQADVNSVTSVVIPAYWKEKPVTEIGSYAFFQYVPRRLEFRNLDSVTMPEGVKRIQDHAFLAASLASTSLPNSVTYIGQFAFQGAGIALTSFPSSLEEVRAAAFEHVKTLQATDFPANVTIWDYPFRWANVAFKNLENVTMRGGKHFMSTEFTAPAEVTLSTPSPRMTSTFEESNVTSVDLTLSTTGTPELKNTFTNCASLTEVTLRYGSGVTDPKIPTYIDAFSGATSLAHIYVPSALVADFKTATGWSDHASIIDAIP